MRKNAERRATVILGPHGSGASRAVEVSQTVVKTLVGIGGVVALLLLVLGGAALSRGVNVTRSRALERENRLLASEIQRLRDRLAGLRDTLNVFSEREQGLRLGRGAGPPRRRAQAGAAPARRPGADGRRRAAGRHRRADGSMVGAGQLGGGGAERRAGARRP